MDRNDNWGHAARFGIFVVAREVVPEAEWWAMRPDGVSVHAARVTASAPWAPWRADRSGVAVTDELERGLAAFRDIEARVVVLAHSSSSFVAGPGWDEAAIAAMGPHLAPGAIATTNGLDIRMALAHLGIARPFLVMPAWMTDAVIASAVAYLAAHGLPVAAASRHVPPPPWQDIAPQNLYREGMAIAQETDTLRAQVCALCPPEADGVLLAGTGLRCSALIEAIEASLGRPVVAANQASLWRALRACGITAPVEGYGRLLRS